MSKYKFNPNYTVAPGETLKELLEMKELTSVSFSEKIDVPHEIVEGILEGNEPITVEIANKFQMHLNVPATFWMNLENNHRERLKNGASML